MRILLHLFAVILLTSCYSTRYYTVSGANTVKNEYHQIVVENDTVRIVYDFSGRNGPVNINIYNKTTQVLEVNWKKSALIYNEQVYSYFDPALGVKGEFSNVSGIRSVDARVRQDEEKQYLPPGSSLQKTPIYLLRSHIPGVSFKNQEKEVIRGRMQTKVKVQKAKYSPERSPFRFRSFLALSLGSPGTEFFMDNKFYISEIWISSNTVSSMPEDVLSAGDLFYF